MDNAKGSCINFPCYVRVDISGTPYLTAELAFALSVNKTLDGTDCPAEKCSVCGDLVEEGVNFCSNCGRMFIRNA